MNTVSSRTASNANAVCTIGRSGTTYDHRARTHEPISGCAAPATNARAAAAGVPHAPSTAAIVSSSAPEDSSTLAGSSRLCPNRSTSRPCTIANSELATT
jgi:hypothetical protein